MERLGRSIDPRWWAGIVIGLGVLIRLPQLGHSLAGDHAFRQTQTAFAIRGFAEQGVNLLHSPLPVFGSATDVPLEFPLFQALTRQLMRLGLDDSSAGRLGGLLAFQMAAILWWMILRRWRGVSLGTTALVLMEFLPFGLHWGAACLIDFFSVALGLVMVLGFDVWLRSRTRVQWLGLAACALGAWSVFLVKVTTVPSVGTLLLVCVALATLDVGWKDIWRRASLGLLVGPATALVGLVLWTHHADRIKEKFVATDFLTSGNTWSWNFGGSRLSRTAWEGIAQRATDEIVGFGGAVLVIGLLLSFVLGGRRTSILVGGLVLSAIAPVIIFFNLFARHSYYLVAIFPACIALCALAPILLWESAPRRALPFAVPPLLLVALLFGTTMASPLGRNDLDELTHDRAIPQVSVDLENTTPRDARIITVGCDWDPEILYFAHRTGLMFQSIDRREVDAIWRQNDIRDYRYLARCTPGAPIADFLPPSTTWQPTAAPDVFELMPSSG